MLFLKGALMKIILCVLATIVAACSSHHKDPVNPPTKAVSEIHSDTLKSVAGSVTIEDMEKEYKITADLKGLKPNSKFGFHVHQNGICEGPDYRTAGDHFNPHKKPHGRPDSNERHEGDLGNLVTNANGEAKQVLLVPKTEGDTFDQFVNKSVLVHSGVDDLKSQPSGNSGTRIACGIIKPI